VGQGWASRVKIKSGGLKWQGAAKKIDTSVFKFGGAGGLLINEGRKRRKKGKHRPHVSGAGGNVENDIVSNKRYLENKITKIEERKKEGGGGGRQRRGKSFYGD